MNARFTPYGQEVSPAHRDDQLPGGAVFAVCFTALAFLIFAFPWLVAFLLHISGGF